MKIEPFMVRKVLLLIAFFLSLNPCDKENQEDYCVDTKAQVILSIDFAVYGALWMLKFILIFWQYLTNGLTSTWLIYF